MSDITMCLCEECKMKSSCYRARANPDFFYQGYADFTEFCQKDGYKYYIEDWKKKQAVGAIWGNWFSKKCERRWNGLNDTIIVLLIIYGFVTIIMSFGWFILYGGEFIPFLKSWMNNKNWFGKLYMMPIVIFCFPAIILTFLFELIVLIVAEITLLGIKKEYRKKIKMEDKNNV